MMRAGTLQIYRVFLLTDARYLPGLYEIRLEANLPPAPAQPHSGVVVAQCDRP